MQAYLEKTKKLGEIFPLECEILKKIL